MKTKTILISGASIAGPALAYWLHRHGFQVTVIERAPALRPGGYKVDIRGAATEVIARMGLREDAHRLAVDMRDAWFVDAQGKRLATMDADLFGMREGDDTELMRGDLATLLHERTRDTAEYLFGDSITGLREDAAGVHVTFERAPPRTFDLVIGADGLHSNVRALTFGDEAKFIRPLGHYVSIFTVPNHLGLDRSEVVYPMPGRLVNVYSTKEDPSHARALFFFKSPPLTYDRRDVAAQKRLLAEAYAGAGWEVSWLLTELERAPDFYFDSLCTVGMDRWSRGRIALLGDAAFCASPASGQGTSLALVGAYVLAGELAAAEGDHSVAFARYEQSLRPFVTRNQKLADNLKHMVPGSAFALWFQMINLRLLPYVPRWYKGFIAEQVHKEIRGAANGISLPAYAA